MSTMMTFEYLSQLCQNKEQVFSQPGGLKDSRGEETLSRTPGTFYRLKRDNTCA